MHILYIVAYNGIASTEESLKLFLFTAFDSILLKLIRNSELIKSLALLINFIYHYIYTTHQRPTKRNCRSHNDALQKHQSKSPFSRWRHRLLWHCSRCTARRHISPIPISSVKTTYIEHLLIKIKENSFKLTKERSRRYPTKTITYTETKTLLHSLEQPTAGINLHVNAHKTEYMCFNQTGNIFTLKCSSVKLTDKFTDLGSSVSSTDTDIDTRLAKAWTAIDRLSVIWKSDLTDKMKCSFLQAAVMSILLYGCITWMLTKYMERKLDSNYTRMLRAIMY